MATGRVSVEALIDRGQYQSSLRNVRHSPRSIAGPTRGSTQRMIRSFQLQATYVSSCRSMGI